MPELVTSEKNRWKATIPRDPMGYSGHGCPPLAYFLRWIVVPIYVIKSQPTDIKSERIIVGNTSVNGSGKMQEMHNNTIIYHTPAHARA